MLMDFEHCASMVYESWLVVHIRYCHFCLYMSLNDLDSNPNIEHNSISYISTIDRSIGPYLNTIVHLHLHMARYRINRDQSESKTNSSFTKIKARAEWHLLLCKTYRIRSLNSSPSLPRNNYAYWRRPHVQNLFIDNIWSLRFCSQCEESHQSGIYFYPYRSLHIPHLQIIPDISVLRHRLSSFHVKLRQTPFDWHIRWNSVVVPNCHTHSMNDHFQQTIENLPKRWRRGFSLITCHWKTNHKPRNNLNLNRAKSCLSFLPF